jgi:subfamily B ATP-binding cassette protein MsbA
MELRFEKVYFTYNDVDTVLCNVDMVARKGEIIALVGPSGAGKSTMARLIPRFYDPTSGGIAIDGVDLRDVTLSSLRSQIGLVTQEIILFNDTVASNIAYGKPDAGRSEIEAAAKAANADEFIAELPDGYNTVVGEKGLVLSGGQRQRIALARAILKDPAILILDEATSSLDSQSEYLIQQAMDKFMEHRTSIVIAHRLSTIERASRIYVVEDGEIVAEGTNRELLDRSPLYKKLHSIQFSTAEV